MLNRFARWLRPAEVKASVSGGAAVYFGARAVWTPRDYGALATAGFQRNAVVHRAVRLVAEAAASLPMSLTENGRALDVHPLLTLLHRPNRRQGGGRFLEEVYGHLMVSGNAYVEVLRIDERAAELHALRPDRMRVVTGPDGWIEGYDYGAGSATRRYSVGQGPDPILHLTLFHPTDDHYGLSPMEAAATALDIHNAAGAWNKALLDNAARPSGALVLEGSGNLSDRQFDKLRSELDESFRGAANAGRPMLLDGGLSWQSMSLTPKDMDFIEAKAVAAREIALAFGVPPLLLGLPGDNTHANYAEANRSFYRQTVIPLARRTGEAFAAWLGTPEIRLEPDLDAIEALAPERESLWRRVTAADFLTADEKREAVGYGRR